MSTFKRISLFILTNLGLMISVSVLIFILQSVFGLQITRNLSQWYASLALYAAIFGFSTAFISLAISRMMAKWTYKIELINETRLMDQSPKIQSVYTTVADIAKRNGIQMPEVGVYDSPEPNAFATGPTRNRALVAVSTWLLDTMTQWEIEWVVGHEMAHVLNGDMVTMVLLQGILNTIVIFVARVAGSLIAGAISKSDDGPSPWLSGLISLVLEIALGFAAMIVLMAFSRHREYHADLGSAKYLGKDRMIAALKKLNTLHDDLAGKIETDGRIATMQISSYKISSLFSSHPPLADRIKALQDRYDVA